MIPSGFAATLADCYRVERTLGEGGMATVYLAHDLKHDRKVALKVLRPELGAVLGAERFHAEIRTTARLQHPHILPLLDSGDADGLLYFTMPYVTGETLRQRLTRERQLSLDESLRVTRAVAAALDFAHAHGVIHRDLKPENVLFQANEPVLADFGIALAAATAGGARLTEAGLSPGTPQYMSPEQAAGDRILDARSDVYALACLTYEMLAGEPPHTGATTPAVLMKIMTQVPTPVSVVRPGMPRSVDAALARALAKAPADRFETAGAFAAALTAPSSPHEAPDKSIVVLPFANLSPNAADEFMADGLTDEVILELSRLKRLRVISRNSAKRFKGTAKDTRTIGRELGVRYVLEGSVRRAGDSLRVVTQLVEAETETTVFAERFVGTLADAQDILEQLARRISAAMRVTLTAQESETFARRRVEHPEAFELALRARKLIATFEFGRVEEALRHVRSALALEPDNPHLIALLAYATFARYNAWSDDEGLTREAMHLADRALALDPTEALACLTKGTILANGVGTITDRAEGVRWLHRSVSLEPAGDACAWLVFVMGALGRAEEGAALADRALVVDPLDTLLLSTAAWVNLMRGEPQRASDLIDRALAVQRDEPFIRWQAAHIKAAIGAMDDARAILGERVPAGGIIGTLTDVLRMALDGDGAGAHSRANRPGDRAVFARDWGWTYSLATELAQAGATELALELLEVAVANGWAQADLPARHDHMIAGLRGDPRFTVLVERMRLQASSIELPSVDELFVRRETPA